MSRVHDRGGWPTDEAIDQSGHELSDWEKQTHALRAALAANGLMNVDELRRGIESLPPEPYEALSYYERWASSMERILVEKGLLSAEEIDEKVTSLASRWE